MIKILLIGFLHAGAEMPASSLGIYDSKEDSFKELTSRYVELELKFEELKDIIYECCYEEMDLKQKERFLRIIYQFKKDK